MTQSAGVTTSRSPGAAVPAAAPDADALAFAKTLAASCARTIGESVAGVILHGSLTLGDYVPGRSDVDLLVVVDAPLTDAQSPRCPRPWLRFGRGRRAGSICGWSPGGSRPRRPGAADGRLYRDHPGVRLRAVRGAPAPRRTRPGGGVLDVPRPRSEPGGGGAGRAAWRGSSPMGAGRGRCAVGGLGGDRRRPAACRANGADDLPHLALGRGGRYGSKTAAGEWALRRDPTLTVVRDALARRRGEPTAPLDPAQVAQLLTLVQARLAQARDSG